MIQEEAFRCKNITERLLDFSRSGERRREPTDLGELVQIGPRHRRSTCRTAGASRSSSRRRRARRHGRIAAAVNAEEIKSVVLNLVVNALDSMEEGGS